MRKGHDCDYNKWNISLVICDIDITQLSTNHGGSSRKLET